LLAGVPEEERSECWWLVLPDRRLVPGNRGGGLQLLTAMQRTAPVGRVVRALRLSPLLDALDKLVSNHLKRLGRFVPDGPAPRRFP
jgi:hypothetical protein